MLVGDIIFYCDKKFGHHRFYEVKAVCLGGEGQEGLIELKCLNHKPGEDVDGNIHVTTWVPEPLLRDACVYSRAMTGPKMKEADDIIP